MLVRAIAAAVSAALAGCSTCVPVHGTYEEVWSGTRTVTESIPEQSAVRLSAVAGTIEIVSIPSDLGGELHHRVRIDPVGAEGPREHRVCVRVQYLAPGPDDPEAIRTRRRPDLEQALCDLITRRFGSADGDGDG